LRSGGAAGTQAGYGGHHSPTDNPGNGNAELAAATQLCTEAKARGIACTLHEQPGRHSWQFAATAFSDALPWLAGRVGAEGTPTGAPAQGAPAAAPTDTAAAAVTTPTMAATHPATSVSSGSAPSTAEGVATH